MPRTRAHVARAAAVAAVALGAAAGWSWRRADPAVAPGTGDAARTDRAAAPAAPTAPPPWAQAVVAVVVAADDGAAVALLDGGAPGGRPAPRRLVGGFEAIGQLAFAPDGRRLAFAARRDGRWDLFAVDRDGHGLTRLTDDAAYDADPAWSPDGSALAYSAVVDGRLAVFQRAVPAASDAGGIASADAGGIAAPVRLSDGDGPAIEPRWSPDGSRIAFAAWHDGAYRIESVAPDGGARQVVAPAAATDGGGGAGGVAGGDSGAAARRAPTAGQRPPEDLRAPRWAPDGGAIAYLAGRHGALRLDVQPLVDGRPHGPSTTLAPAAAAFAWLDGATVVHLTGGRGGRAIGARSRERFGRAELAALPGDPLPLGAGAAALAVAAAEPGDARLAALPGAAPTAPAGGRRDAPDGDDRPGLVDVPGVRVAGPRIHAGLADDFGALRAEVAAATGTDFLGTLSDLWRPVGFHSSASAYFSWHKTGRAFDTQMELRGPGGRRDMVLVREDNGGGGPQWRMVLRAAAQDGSVGQPLTAPGWTFSAGGGDDRHAADGGHRAATVPAGYWVDFTALAARYGWRRINANARPGFDWRTHWAAIEYWHYERRDGLRWFEAARQVYGDDDLAAAFDPDRLRALAIPLSRLARQGFPAGWQADG